MPARKRKYQIDHQRKDVAIQALKLVIESIDNVEEAFIGTDFQWHRSRRFLTLAWAILEEKTVAELEASMPL